jgi:hypothetical protein
MTTQIEAYDRSRKQYRGGLIFSSIVFFVAWIGYVVVRLSSRSMQVLHILVMVTLFASLIVQVYFAFRSTLLERRIKKDPQLKEALNNELVELNELKAWRASFFSVIGFAAVTALASFFVQINDIMLVVLTAFLVGFGTHNTVVHYLDR